MSRPMTREQLLRVDGIKPMSSAQRNQLLGTFSYTNKANGRITITGGWAAQNIVTVDIPQLKKIAKPVSSGRIEVHRLVAAQLQRAFALLEELDLLRHVLTYDGCFVPRHIGWDPKQPLSTHSWGAAIDLNAAWNGLGAEPAALGAHGTVRPFIGVMEACGFGWGGWWTKPRDGMHFEIFRLVPEADLPILADQAPEPPAPPSPPAVDLAPYREAYAAGMHEPLRALYGALREVLGFDERTQAAATRALNEFNGVLIEAGVKEAG